MHIAVAIIVVAIIVGLLIRQRTMQRDALQASFQAQEFNTPAGKVAGRELRVVKTASIAAPTPNIVEGISTKARDEFWYCVGPGPSYFLAIPTIGVQYGAVAFVRWVVRPLSEERMRGTLAEDRRAWKLAFGEAIDA